MTTPAALGFRLPAEWEPHHATWIGWPHNKSDWPGKFAAVEWVYSEIARKLVGGEVVRILVNSAAHEHRARRLLTRAGVALDRVAFVRCPTDRGWTRDYGPLFLRRPQAGGELAIARFRFNAWAKYPDWKRDARVPERVAARLKLPLFQARAGGRDVVLEGGSVDVNGHGTLLTTEECLLDPAVQARNPGLSRADLEAVLRDYLGAPNVLWLGSGIAGDDTHGHVDDVCRFVTPTTVVACRETDPRDANYRALEDNHDRLAAMRLEDGSKVEVIDLPMPAPLVFDGQRLPASYANFYIANAAVLVPTFNDPQDRVALGVLAELIRDRPVVGIHAVDLVWGLGTLHCLTQQEPRVAEAAGARAASPRGPGSPAPRG
ncbi:MAG TPA: agmatine deiminase family protein [Gemmatimonadales bacterium]|nr:agmatine deiminase family protein [Gemmatimonadales bacterium]